MRGVLAYLECVVSRAEIKTPGSKRHVTHVSIASTSTQSTRRLLDTTQVETSEAAEDMSRHGQACDDVCANMCPSDWNDTEECRALCSLKLACPALNEAYYYDLGADNAAEVECVDLSVEACEAAIMTAEAGFGPVVVGPLRDAAVGEACRAAFARDELSEDDDATARVLYAGEARETAKTL